MSTSASFCNYIYSPGWFLIKINMIEEICNLSRMNNSCQVKVENKKSQNDIEFDKIVKFLNDQKEVMDYAGSLCTNTGSCQYKGTLWKL